MNPILKQNKITGLSIAWAKGTWDEEEGAYTFEGDTAFEQRVTDEWMNENGVSEDDLIDCVEQIEDRFGSPEETRLSLGLFTNSGASNVGETAISRTNPAINCVFTPVSDKGGNVDGMFEWFYSPDQSQDISIADYMSNMGMMKSDPYAGDIPVEMPSYAEASEYLFRSTTLSEAAKHKFLEGVYHFHRTKSRGFKMNLREELLPQWKKLKSPIAEASALEKSESWEALKKEADKHYDDYAKALRKDDMKAAEAAAKLHNETLKQIPKNKWRGSMLLSMGKAK